MVVVVGAVEDVEAAEVVVEEVEDVEEEVGVVVVVAGIDAP